MPGLVIVHVGDVQRSFNIPDDQIDKVVKQLSNTSNRVLSFVPIVDRSQNPNVTGAETFIFLEKVIQIDVVKISSLQIAKIMPEVPTLQ